MTYRSDGIKFIPTIFHGVADYLVGFLVIALPYFYHWDGNLKVACILLGSFVVFYSALTDYELGLVRYLRVRVHLLLDAIFGLAVLIMPSIFALPPSGNIFYFIGSLAIVLPAVTEPHARYTQ